MMTRTMRALVAESGNVQLLQVPVPQLQRNNDVLVRVAAAGICRTDAYVAKGIIPTDRAITLGHELSGVVVDFGNAVTDLKRGAHVTADPVLPCGCCAGCKKGTSCFDPSTLGLDLHGCFADYVVLPSSMLRAVPASMTPFEAAYVEPVAACLAIFDAGFTTQERGVVAGTNRFARLTRTLLTDRGYDCDRRLASVEDCSLDYAIETGLSPDGVHALVQALRPGGTLILKSRSPNPLPIGARELVLKQLRVQAALYGSFSEAIALIAENGVGLQEANIQQFSLESFSEGLLDSPESELTKGFFVMNGNGEWPECAA